MQDWIEENWLRFRSDGILWKASTTSQHGLATSSPGFLTGARHAERGARAFVSVTIRKFMCAEC